MFPTIWPVQLSLLSTRPWQRIRPRCRMGAPPHPPSHPRETAPRHCSPPGNLPRWGPSRGTTPLWPWFRMGMCLPPLPYSEHQKAQNLSVSHRGVRVARCSLPSSPSHRCLWSLKTGHMQDRRQHSSRSSSPEHSHSICKVTAKGQTAPSAESFAFEFGGWNVFGLSIIAHLQKSCNTSVRNSLYSDCVPPPFYPQLFTCVS